MLSDDLIDTLVDLAISAGESDARRQNKRVCAPCFYDALTRCLVLGVTAYLRLESGSIELTSIAQASGLEAARLTWSGACPLKEKS